MRRIGADRTDPRVHVVRVLVADGRRVIGEAAALCLGRRGMDVRLVGDGSVVMATAKRFRPHVIVLDQELPGGSQELAGTLADAMPDSVVLSGGSLVSTGRKGLSKRPKRSPKAFASDVVVEVPPGRTVVPRFEMTNGSTFEKAVVEAAGLNDRRSCPKRAGR